MRMRTPAVLTTLFAATVAHAQVTPKPKPAAAPTAAAQVAPKPTGTAADKPAAAQSSLAGRLAAPELNFDQIALTDAIDFFRDATRANFVVDWKALQEVGVSRETPVSLKLRGVATGVALRKTLEAAAPGLLAFYVDQNIIEITTKLAADNRMVTRIYAVADLLADVPDFQGPSLSLSSAGSGGGRNGSSGSGSQSGSSGSGSSGGLFGGSGGGDSQSSQTTAATRKPMADRAQDLIDIIQTTIRPEVWNVNGGKAAIRYLTGKIVVTAPIAVQELIGG